MLESIAAFWAEYGEVLVEGSWETLIMVTLSTVLAYVIGVPLGVALIITQPRASGPTGPSTACWAGSSTSAGPCPLRSFWWP